MNEKGGKNMIDCILAIIKTLTIMLSCLLVALTIVSVYFVIGFTTYILTDKKVNIVRPIIKRIYSFLFK